VRVAGDKGRKKMGWTKFPEAGVENDYFHDGLERRTRDP